MKIGLRAIIASYVNDRTPEWNQASVDHKRANSTCAYCGRKDKVEAHDKLPYHKLTEAQKHDYAFIRKNLVSLCRRTNDNWGCHFSIGHCGDKTYQAYNSDVDKAVAAYQKWRKSCRT